MQNETVTHSSDDPNWINRKKVEISKRMIRAKF